MERRMTSPYEDLPGRAFWRTGVADQPPNAVESLYQRKFRFEPMMRFATAGSCFAQHLTWHLRERGLNIVDEEPAPAGFRAESAREFGYGILSARYGNIYTARQLRQLIQEARGEFQPEDIIWEKNGRYYDALRPGVEPLGVSRPETVIEYRAYHLSRVRRVFQNADIFVFTLGLTEAWEHEPSGTVYPTAPGTIAGILNPQIHRFHNFTFQEIYDDLTTFFELCKKENPNISFLLTVSPVPLTATASSEHVLAATTYSKSVLRAVAGQLYHERADVDYMPAYEVITNPQAGGQFYENNVRSIRSAGVEAVMNMFFSQLGGVEVQAGMSAGNAPKSAALDIRERERIEEEVVCEEELLEQFAP
jgi:hypothetical protein